MQPLIDADILRYEIGHCGQYNEIDEETKEPVLKIREWEFVQKLLDDRIRGICLDVEASEPPILFLTANSHSIRLLNKQRKRQGEDSLSLLPQFRELVAVTKPYKGTRKADKPFHFDNLTAYLLANYDCRVGNGIEADDLMALEQCARPDSTIICSRDKDLRMVAGWHFGWECGLQPSFGPELVDARGRLWYNNREEVKGTGLKFFFYQMLVGDTVDNIAGCKGIGPKKAMAALVSCNTKAEHEAAIISLYKEAYVEEWVTKLKEMSALLWMARELDEQGMPVPYDWKLN